MDTFAIYIYIYVYSSFTYLYIARTAERVFFVFFFLVPSMQVGEKLRVVLYYMIYNIVFINRDTSLAYVR